MHNYAITEIMPAKELLVCVCMHTFRKIQPWLVVSELSRARAAPSRVRCAACTDGDIPQERVGYYFYHLWVNLALITK